MGTPSTARDDDLDPPDVLLDWRPPAGLAVEAIEVSNDPGQDVVLALRDLPGKARRVVKIRPNPATVAEELDRAARQMIERSRSRVAR